MEKLRSDTPKKQHFVPQLLLRHFATVRGDTHKIFAYSKARQVSYPTSVGDVAQGRGFYNIVNDKIAKTLEHKLCELEGQSADSIKKVCREGTLGTLTSVERQAIAFFAALQYVRTPRQRQLQAEVAANIRNLYQAAGAPQEVLDELSSDTDTERHIEGLVQLAEELSVVLMKKEMILMQAPVDLDLYISDNPVTTQNVCDELRLASFGVDSLGAQTNLPISNKLNIAFLCEKAAIVYRHNRGPSSRTEHLSEANVINLNALQVTHAVEYIYSVNNNFDLARGMLGAYPALAYQKLITTA